MYALPSLVHFLNISLVTLPLVFLRTIRVFSVGLPNKSQQIRSPCVLKPRSPTHTISKREKGAPIRWPVHKLTKAWGLSSAPFFVPNGRSPKCWKRQEDSRHGGSGFPSSFCGGFSAASFLWEVRERKRSEFVEHFTGADDVYRMSTEWEQSVDKCWGDEMISSWHIGICFSNTKV